MTYPKRVGHDLVWACCESSIGPVCQHRAPPPMTVDDMIDALQRFKAQGMGMGRFTVSTLVGGILEPITHVSAYLGSGVVLDRRPRDLIDRPEG